MPWKIVERKIGKAGGHKQRAQRQLEWDQKYGEGNWETGYLIDGEFVSQENAFESVERSRFAAAVEVERER